MFSTHPICDGKVDDVNINVWCGTKAIGTKMCSNKLEISCKMQEFEVDLDTLKECQPQQVDVSEQSSIVVVKDKQELYAFSAKCSHLGGPLKSGFYMNGRIRCPWHGACFNAKTGDIEDFPCTDAIYGFKVGFAETGQ
jgi:nitrite reductase/ring-hydroxylating ferredoxin subunit